jgi:hypothetical protein
VPLQRVGIFLIFASALLVLEPVFTGNLDTAKGHFGAGFPWALLGAFGPIGPFFLWFGMWLILGKTRQCEALDIIWLYRE